MHIHCLGACHTAPVTEICACRPHDHFAFSLVSKWGRTCYHKRTCYSRWRHVKGKGEQKVGGKVRKVLKDKKVISKNFRLVEEKGTKDQRAIYTMLPTGFSICMYSLLAIYERSE